MKELYYSVEQAAELLGVSKATVYTWCNTGKLDGARQIGRTWFIPKATIDPPLPTPPNQAIDMTNRKASD